MNSVFKVRSADSEKYVKSRPLKSSNKNKYPDSASETFYVFGESDISDEEIVYQSCEMQDIRYITSNNQQERQSQSYAIKNNDTNKIDPNGVSGTCYSLKPYKDVPVDDWDVFHHQIQGDDSLQNLSIKYAVPVPEIKRINNLMKDQEFYALRSIKIPVRKHGVLSELLSETKKNNEATSSTSKDFNQEGCASSLVRTINLGIGNKVNGIADGKSVSSFFHEMDEDLEKIRDYSKSYKDSLDEVTSTLTCKRFKPLNSNSKSIYKCMETEGCIRWKCLILIIILFAIILPVLFIYYYIKTGHSFLKP